MYAIKTVLHPTDFSEQSEFAFRVACSLARAHGARLLVLSVLPPPVVYPGGEMLRIIPEAECDHAWCEAQFRMLAPVPSIRLEFRSEIGEPVAQIDRVAREMGCDLIVMGTHGRTGLRRLVMGSVAEQVLRTAPCPVLTVRGHFPEHAPVRGSTGNETATRAVPTPRYANGGPVPGIELGVGD